MGWITLVLASTFFTAGSSIVDKKVMNGSAIHPFACAASFGVVGLPVAIVGVMILRTPSWPQALLGMVAGVIFIPAAWLYYDTVARVEVSRVIPILRLSSLQIVFFGALFLGEVLTGRQWLAFLFLLVGSVLLSIEAGKRGLSFSRAALRLLPATTLLAINGVLMAYMYRTAAVWTGIVWEDVGKMMAVLVISLARAQHRWVQRNAVTWLPQRVVLRSLIRGNGVMVSLVGAMRAVVRQISVDTFRWSGAERLVWSVLIAEQSMRLIEEVATAMALAHGVPVALTSALSSARLVWVWLLAILLLKERVGHLDLFFRCSGMVGMSVGVYLLM
jgi:uncharacterized membrane protein